MPTVWGNVPQRNKNFTGREDLLDALHQRVTGEVTAVLAHALHGMGGVGKTQLAIEYAYRYMSDYEMVWWISADQLPLVRSALAALAPRLGLENVVTPGRLEDAVNAVIDALRRGEPYRRWLLVFDNADQPEEIQSLLPAGTGHVIVTSRNHRWQSVADVVEVDVFSRRESLEFLSRRAPGATPSDSTRLAEELGDLPLALEQAAALQVEAGMSVDEYLDLLARESTRVLAENPPTDYPVGVEAAWSLSVARLQQQTPLAWELLCRCAFFGPEPIQRDILKNGRYVLGPPLGPELADPIMLSRATRELGRYALAKVDNNQKTLQVHRLIQRLIRDGLEPADAEIMRHEVHLLLAAADPDDPDELETWEQYGDLLAHVVPAEVPASSHHDVRRLTRNVVQYLYSVGDLRTCDTLSRDALERWVADSGPDDHDVLILSGQRADLLWERGARQEAFELRTATLQRMRTELGDEHETTLMVTNGHGADLRDRGDFAAALELDQRTLSLSVSVLGDDDDRTLRVANNLAVDYGLNSDYAAALETDTRTHADYLNLFGRDDHPKVVKSLAAIGTDLRQGGRYKEALQTEEQAYNAYADLVRQHILRADHSWVLQQAKGFSVVRRKMGLLKEALHLAEEVHERYLASYYGERHPDALAAAMNLGNARRVYGDFTQNISLMEEADAEIEATYGRYREVYGDNHPYTHGCTLNLAIVRRRVGDPTGARQLLEQALEGLEQRLGEKHHYTLTCLTALATSLSDTGEVERASDAGHRALDGLSSVVGADHPHTLACAANLAIDLRTLGDIETSDELRADAVDRYRRVLFEGHFDVADAAKGERIALDFEPPPL